MPYDIDGNFYEENQTANDGNAGESEARSYADAQTSSASPTNSFGAAQGPTEPEQTPAAPAAGTTYGGDYQNFDRDMSSSISLMQSMTGVDKSLWDSVMNWGKEAGGRLADNIKNKPEIAGEWLAGAIGKAMKSKAEREMVERKYQEEREKEERINASVPKFNPVKGILNKARTLRADGKPMFTSSGKLNRSKQ